MSLRPRYSLLTLLILTAFLAGGVKLWRGPHHVVKPIVPAERVEFFSYTRDWTGNELSKDNILPAPLQSMVTLSEPISLTIALVSHSP